MHSARIVGTGVYLPKNVLSNADLEKLVETSDEWIVTRTGMKERRIAAEEEFTSDMGTAAALQALKNAGVTAEDIDCILVATVTPDYLFPSTACLIQDRLGASKAAALDVQAACSGYVYCLQLAKALIGSGIYRTILLVAAEKLSSITDYQDRNTCILFGDGAGACVISSEGKGLRICGCSLGADGSQGHLLKLAGGGCRHPSSHRTVDQRMHYIQMEGKEVFKHAVRRMESAIKEALNACGLEEDKIGWLIPHQANTRIIEALAKRFSVPEERVYLTLHKYGNTSASSVGIALHELLEEGRIKKGEKVVLATFGGGFTWGGAVLEHE